MSGMVVMALGPHIFYVPLPDNDTPAFETMDRDSQFTWIAANRLSRQPAMQFSGAGEETISIQGRLFPHHFGGLSTIDGLRASGKAGSILTLTRFHPLTDPAGMAGVIIGRYGIRRVRTSEQKVGATGVGHKIDFTVELVQYGEDNGASGDLFFDSGGQNV